MEFTLSDVGMWLTGDNLQRLMLLVSLLALILSAFTYFKSRTQKTQKKLVEKNLSLIENISKNFIELSNKNRIQRREIPLDITEQIFDAMREVHRNYLTILTQVRLACKKDIGNLERQLDFLIKQRVLLEPERTFIIATIKGVRARKWHPLVRDFLSSVDSYFSLQEPLSSLTSSLIDEELAIKHIQHFTGYSRVIHVMQYILRRRVGGKLYLSYHGVDYSDEPSKQVDEIIYETLDLLRSRWDKVSSAYGEIQAESNLA